MSGWGGAEMALKLTPEKIALIHKVMMPGATDDEVKVFVAKCEAKNLDPFAGQIMPTKRKVREEDEHGNWVQRTVWTDLVPIDGLRKIAVDTGDYCGQEGPFWCGPDGAWRDVWLQKEPPKAAKVIVHRKGFTHGLTAVALFESYAQRKSGGALNNVWSNLGAHMIAKCAEALALRKAFPNETGGFILEEELGAVPTGEPQPEGGEPGSQSAPSAPPASEPKPAGKVADWPIPLQERYQGLLDRLYKVLKDGGKASEYDERAAKWKQLAETEGPDACLERLEVFVKKLEDALAEKLKAGQGAPAEPAAPAPPAPSASPAQTIAENWAKIRRSSTYSRMSETKWEEERKRLTKDWSARNAEDPEVGVLDGQTALLDIL